MEKNAASKRKMLDETRPTKVPRVDEEGANEYNECRVYNKPFEKLLPAVEFCKRIGQGVKPFSVEYPGSSSGARKFFAAHPRTVWGNLEDSRESDRNTYEIITENARCKLYFDLEYEFQNNPKTVRQELTQTLMEIVCWALEDKLNVRCAPENVIILEATTNEKFSQHWIFPNVIFHSYRHTGAFVKHILKLIVTGSVPFQERAVEALNAFARQG